MRPSINKTITLAKKRTHLIGSLRLTTPTSSRVFFHSDIPLTDTNISKGDISMSSFSDLKVTHMSKLIYTPVNIDAPKIIEGVFNDIIGSMNDINVVYEVVITIWLEKPSDDESFPRS